MCKGANWQVDYFYSLILPTALFSRQWSGSISRLPNNYRCWITSDISAGFKPRYEQIRSKTRLPGWNRIWAKFQKFGLGFNSVGLKIFSWPFGLISCWLGLKDSFGFLAFLGLFTLKNFPLKKNITITFLEDQCPRSIVGKIWGILDSNQIFCVIIGNVCTHCTV